jgi:transcription elongation factor GreA
MKPMAEPTGVEGAALGAAARDRLENELAEARAQRQGLVAALGGEDPEDPDPGDQGDEALQLEGLDDLGRVNRRIRELERLLASAAVSDVLHGLADGSRVTLRFPNGDVATFRIVAIPQEASSDNQDDVVTADSPLGRALVGRRADDLITYEGPDGDLQAEVLAIDAV